MNLLIAAITVLCIGDSMIDPDVEPLNHCDESIHETTNLGTSFTRALDWAAVPQDNYDGFGVFEVGYLFVSTNDTIFFRTKAQVKADLLTIALKLQVTSPDIVVVISLQPFALGEPGIARNELLATYHEAIRELWVEEDFIRPGVDWTLLPFVNDPVFFLEGENGLHPNAFGHGIAQEPTDEAIVQAVPEPSTFLMLTAGMVFVGILERRKR